MKLVLVVDDDAAVRRCLRRMLERAGYEVQESANGVDALCLLERVTPDILITDLHMPGGDGVELTRALRRGGRAQPRLIVLSGDDHATVQAHASAVGATGLMKPFSRDELLAAIDKTDPPVLAGIRILIVDDQPDVCLAFRYALEMDGFQVADAANGGQALAYLAKEPVDVILTDLYMPGMDGLTLLRYLRNTRAPRPRTIAMTGSACLDRRTALEDAHRLGASAVLEKPISREKLLSTIHSVIDAAPQLSAGN